MGGPLSTDGAGSSGRNWLRDLALGAAGLAAGAGLVLVPGRLRSDSADVVLPVPDSGSVAATIRPSTTTLDEAGAGSAVAAVEQFLAAEQAHDLDASFALLSADDRRDIPDRGTWEAVHADVLPPVLSYEVGNVSEDPDGVVVSSFVEFEPSLDEVRGLVSGPADVSWHVTEDVKGWRVSLARSTMEPIYPDEAQAVPAARRWLDVAPCDPAEAAPANVTFLGSRRDLLRDLCQRGGTAGDEALRLDDRRAHTDLAAAFGSGVDRWARIVPVHGAVAARLVLAPVGDGWTVVDVIAAAKP